MATLQDRNGELQVGNLLYQVAHLYPVEQGKLCYAFDRKYDFTQQYMTRQSRSKNHLMYILISYLPVPYDCQMPIAPVE